MKNRTKKRRAHPPLRRKVFVVLSVFVAVTLTVLWTFQIFLLKPMYESLKMRELRTVSDSIAKNVLEDDLQSRTDSIAKITDICISVYEILGPSARLYANSHIRGSCFLHNVTSDPFMNRLYAGAKRDGYYTEEIEGNLFSPGGSQNGEDTPRSIITAQIVSKDSRSFLIVTNGEIEPVATTTDTLAMQLGIITVLLLLFAGITAVLVSSAISRPISQMSKEAQKLALGTYDVHFDGGDTAETAELGDALNYAAHELSSIDMMQKELLANISHDLRTPLTMISGYSEVMRDIPGEMRAENMQIIIDETQRLTALVNDILDLSKLKNGTQALSCETISLTDTVRQTLTRYAKLVRNGYKIEFMSEKDVFVYADRTKILQVIYNLVNNALNYTGKDKTVIIRVLSVDGDCRFEVTDSGEGIPEDQIALIWDRYYKVKNYYKRAVSGTGLGLSIVKNILLLHGARFGVESTLEKGSTFWFSLPEILPGADSRDA